MMSFFGFLLSKPPKPTNTGGGTEFWAAKNLPIRGLAYGDRRRVVPFVFSGDGRWHPQGEATVEVIAKGIKTWRAPCQFEDDNTKCGTPFKLVIIETNENVSRYPVFDLPSGLKSETYLVRRISRLI